jgi:hypothetical protein
MMLVGRDIKICSCAYLADAYGNLTRKDSTET